MLAIVMATVIRNAVPVVSAAIFSFFLFMVRFVCPCSGEDSSEVIRSTMAFMASRRVTSANVKGGRFNVFCSFCLWFGVCSGGFVSFWRS